MPRLRAKLVMSLLVSSLMGACALNDRGPTSPVAALDKLLPMGLIQVAQEHLKAQRLDPGPVDGIFTEQMAEAIRQYQRRYGMVVSGLLDSATRQHLGVEKTEDSCGG